MCNNFKNVRISASLMKYLADELDTIDGNHAKLTLYHLLLDKYSVPKTHILREKTQHTLSVHELEKMLNDLGFNAFNQVEKNSH